MHYPICYDRDSSERTSEWSCQLKKKRNRQILIHDASFSSISHCISSNSKISQKSLILMDGFEGSWFIIRVPLKKTAEISTSAPFKRNSVIDRDQGTNSGERGWRGGMRGCGHICWAKEAFRSHLHHTALSDQALEPSLLMQISTTKTVPIRVYLVPNVLKSFFRECVCVCVLAPPGIGLQLLVGVLAWEDTSAGRQEEKGHSVCECNVICYSHSIQN